MLTYVIVGLVTVLVLLASFRVLARPRPVPELSQSVGRLVETVFEAGDRMATLLASLPEEAARMQVARLRATLQAEHQQLSLAAEEADARLSSARELLVEAMDDLVWACRLAESERCAQASALADAAGLLVAHARQCAEMAARIVGARGQGESGATP